MKSYKTIYVLLAIVLLCALGLTLFGTTEFFKTLTEEQKENKRKTEIGKINVIVNNKVKGKGFNTKSPAIITAPMDRVKGKNVVTPLHCVQKCDRLKHCVGVTTSTGAKGNIFCQYTWKKGTEYIKK